jgi:hypothetical protein
LNCRNVVKNVVKSINDLLIKAMCCDVMGKVVISAGIFDPNFKMASRDTSSYLNKNNI